MVNLFNFFTVFIVLCSILSSCKTELAQAQSEAIYYLEGFDKETSNQELDSFAAKLYYYIDVDSLQFIWDRIDYKAIVYNGFLDSKANLYELKTMDKILKSPTFNTPAHFLFARKLKYKKWSIKELKTNQLYKTWAEISFSLKDSIAGSNTFSFYVAKKYQDIVILEMKDHNDKVYCGSSIFYSLRNKKLSKDE